MGSLRLAAVNTGTGQLLLKNTIANVANATTINDPTNTYQYGLGTSAQYSGSSSIYGLLLNATSSGLTLSVANSGTLTLNSVIQIKATESVTIAPGTGVSNVVIGAERNLVIAMDNAAGFAISAPIVNNGGGASDVTIVGTAPTGTPGAVTFSGVNTYTGATSIHNNVLSLNNANTLGTTPGVNGTSAINMTNGATLSSAVSGANPVNTIAAPITLSGTGNATLRIGQGASSNTHTFNINGAIGGTTGNVVYTTGAASFSNGISQFVLGAAGTYTGNTLITTGNGANNPVFIKAGTGIVNALPVTTTLTFDGTAGGGTGRLYLYDLNGNDQTLAGLTNTVANLRAQRVTNTGALATLTINNTTDMSFGGSSLNVANSATNRAQIQGAIALTKSGSGTFTLGGALLTGATAGGNTHTGDTKILAGILVLGETLSLQNSAFDTANSIAGDATNGLRSSVTTLTLGGLKGGNNFSTRFTSTTGGYTGLTALTLNPGTGVTNTYSGDVGDGATGMTLTKSGAGTQILAGTNTHNGATAVNAGTLVVNGNISTSNVTVSGSGTLKGSGTISGSVTVNSGGTLASGTSIESLATGTLSLTNLANFEYELDKDAAANVAGDLTAVTGNLSLAGTVNLSFLETGTGAWELGTPLGDHFGTTPSDKLTLISYTGTWNNGLFTYLGNLVPDDSGILINGQQWWFNYNDTDAGINFTGDLTGATFVTITVPEPNVAALLGALGTLILLRRRR